MATVATLTIDLIANSGRLNKDLRKATKNTKGWADTTRRQVNVAGRAFGAMGVTGVAALTAIYAQSAKSGDSLAKLSDQLGEMPERVTRLQHAAELTSTGGTEMLNKSLETMNKRLGEARQGTGEAAKYLEQLGLANESFFALSPADKVGELADRFATLNDNEERAAAAAAIFGRSGGEMVNVLAAGKEGLKAMADEADALGITMDRIKLAKIEAANDSFHRATQTGKSFGNTLATEVAPFVGAISEEFANAAKEAGGFGQVAVNVVSSTAEGVAFAADMVRGLEVAWMGVRQAVVEVLNAQVQFATVGARGANWLAEKVGLDDTSVGQALRKVTDFSDSISDTADEMGEEWNERALATMPSEKIKKWVEDVRAKAEVAAKEVAANRKLNVLGDVAGTGGGAGDTAQETERIISAQRDRFSRIHEEMLLADDRVIELENYRKERADLELEQDLERIRTKGLLTQEIESEFRTAREQADKVHQKRIEKLESGKYANLTKMGDDFIAMSMSGQQDMRTGLKRLLMQSVADHIKAKAVESEASGLAAIQAAIAAPPGFPYNMGGVLAATAKTMAITAAVSALTPSFDGGGYTGSGARSGGLDGKGGFMAMLHPRETVVDHTKGQSLGDSSNVQFSLTVVNELGVAANADIEQDGDTFRLYLRQMEEKFMNDVDSLQGIGRSIQQKFKLPVAGSF